MPKTNDFTVLVNTSDGFEDCWDPFFTLYQRYWTQANAMVLLNTETKDFRHPEVPVRATRVQAPGTPRLTWSECLIAGLAQVKTPLVLYMQEDYFLHAPVDHERVIAAAAYMRDNPEVVHVGLTRHGSHGPFTPHAHSGMLTIGQKAKYRISTQAGLWRVQGLQSYLVPRENGWMFEIYGSWRAHARNDTFLTMRFDDEAGGPPIDYLHTGIVKGRWLREIEGVFASNGIAVDFSRRGFYRPKHPIARRIETARRLAEHPVYFLKQLLQNHS